MACAQMVYHLLCWYSDRTGLVLMTSGEVVTVV